MKPICLDSSGWIEIALDGANAKPFVKALTSPAQLIVSAISIYEIAKYTTREAGEAAALEVLSFIRQYPVIEVTADLSQFAANLSLRHQLAMADSLIYASTLAENATLWTQDEDFKNLPHVRYFPKSKPHP